MCPEVRSVFSGCSVLDVGGCFRDALGMVSECAGRSPHILVYIVTMLSALPRRVLGVFRDILGCSVDVLGIVWDALGCCWHVSQMFSKCIRDDTGCSQTLS